MNCAQRHEEHKDCAQRRKEILYRKKEVKESVLISLPLGVFARKLEKTKETVTLTVFIDGGAFV
ncbi:MAG: hypothetical protein LBQ50_14210 [Planctomycetaceae bacterium]|jgi:hypothetical protein|nr:hypothetical protein [Planctomycetaceae bacterium]